MATSTNLVVDVVDTPVSTISPIEGTAVAGVVIIPPSTWPATPITAPTGTGTGTVITSPTVPSVPVTAQTGAAIGGDASTGITEPIQAPTVSAPSATVTVGSNAISPSVNVIGSQAVFAPTVSTTVTNNGTTTQTIACKCCGAASDPCCGPFDRAGPYFNRWFKGTEWSSAIVGRGKTTAPAKFVLTINFENAGTWNSPGDDNTDLQQYFDLEFEYYDPGEVVSLPYPFSRYEVARWTNTGPVKCRLQGDFYWSDGSTTDPYRGKIGNVWLNFESEYIYILTGYRNVNDFFGGNYQTFDPSDLANSFVLLSSLENLNTDTFSYVQNGEAAKPSSYKVFFQRWNPKTASVYGYRYHMKTAQCLQTNLGPTIDQMTKVPAINGCPLRILTRGNRPTTAPIDRALVFSVESCALGNCNSFGANLSLRRDQDCACPNGYAKSLFGPDGLCPSIDLGFIKPEIQVDLTAYTHIAPYSAANTSNPTIPMRMGYAGLNGLKYCDGSLTSYNSLIGQQGTDLTKKELVFDRFSPWVQFELQPTGDPIKMTIANFDINTDLKYAPNTTFYTWSSLSNWGLNYQYVILRGPKTGSTIPDGVLKYVSHSCSPFSMTFAGSLWMSYGRYYNYYDTHIANVEITFSLPFNGLVSMAGPPAQAPNPTVDQDTPGVSSGLVKHITNKQMERIKLPCIHRGERLASGFT